MVIPGAYPGRGWWWQGMKSMSGGSAKIRRVTEPGLLEECGPPGLQKGSPGDGPLPPADDRWAGPVPQEQPSYFYR